MSNVLKLALPKGRMQEGVTALMADAGIKLRAGSRGYRPHVSMPGIEAKILKPQSIVEMLRAGSRDVGFAGADWVAELGATDSLVELVDTEMDPVRLVAAAPTEMLSGGKLRTDLGRPLVVASEYGHLTRTWIAKNSPGAIFVHSYGATEVFPPEDADCIVDNTASGATLAANGLEIIDELMRSSTRMYANPRALDVPEKREIVDRLIMLLRSVLEARKRVMLEMNVTPDAFETICAALPCMREPTVSPLHGNAGFAVKAAVPRNTLPQLIPELKALGATDIVVSALGQIVP